MLAGAGDPAAVSPRGSLINLGQEEQVQDWDTSAAEVSAMEPTAVDRTRCGACLRPGPTAYGVCRPCHEEAMLFAALAGRDRAMARAAARRRRDLTVVPR